MSEVVHNRFELLDERGSGGAGEVHEALDRKLKRKVALKRVRRDAHGDRRERASRLVREAETLARVAHPNIVAVHDIIEEADAVTIVMELVDGIPFRELYRKQPVPQAELLGYLRQLLAALDRVHAAGIVHRDVNPRNVLVIPDGSLKLTDFGLATSIHDPHPRAGGSLGYMPPEALKRGGHLGFGVDIYGAGMLTYQALLGAPAFQRLYGTVKPVSWARWLLSRERFRPLEELEAPACGPVSGALSDVVARMLEKDPRLRYSKVADVVRDLEGAGPAPGPTGLTGPTGPTAVAGARPGVAAAPAAGPDLVPGVARGPSLAAAVRRLIPSILARPQEKP